MGARQCGFVRSHRNTSAAVRSSTATRRRPIARTRWTLAGDHPRPNSPHGCSEDMEGVALSIMNAVRDASIPHVNHGPVVVQYSFAKDILFNTHVQHPEAAATIHHCLHPRQRLHIPCLVDDGDIEISAATIERHTPGSPCAHSHVMSRGEE